MKYDPALDGLRAVSVAVVLVLHAYESFMPGGWAGVEIFFVLSGFLITNILLRELEERERINLGRFYIRRFLRLGPALIALLIFCLALAPFQGRNMNWVEWGAAATYTMNWYRAFGIGADDMLGYTWSLAIEEQFYLIWPAFLIILPRRVQLPISASLIGAVMLWRGYLGMIGEDPYRADGFDAHCDTLLIGCVAALLWRDDTPRIPDWLGYSALAGLGGLVLTLPEGHVMMAFGIPAVGVLGCVTMLFARQSGPIRTILMTRPFVYTGRISYGLYLWHYPIVVLAVRHLSPAMMWLPLVLAYVVAVLSHRFIEAPALKLKSWFEPAAMPRHGVVPVTEPS